MLLFVRMGSQPQFRKSSSRTLQGHYIPGSRCRSTLASYYLLLIRIGGECLSARPSLAFPPACRDMDASPTDSQAHSLRDIVACYVRDGSFPKRFMRPHRGIIPPVERCQRLPSRRKTIAQAVLSKSALHALCCHNCASRV